MVASHDTLVGRARVVDAERPPRPSELARGIDSATLVLQHVHLLAGKDCQPGLEQRRVRAPSCCLEDVEGGEVMTIPGELKAKVRDRSFDGIAYEDEQRRIRHRLGCLVESMSIRATCRITGVARMTVNKLILDLGAACAEHQDRYVRDLATQRVEADETWSFCYSKAKNVPEEHKDTFGYGDVWTWVAIDADSKLVASWLVGERTTQDCYAFLADLRDRVRVGQRIQLTTDGLGIYPPVVHALWGNGIDYAVMVKEYGNPSKEEQRRYSPAVCTAIDVRVMSGNPDESKISTSYVERQNLTMRMGMRRYTRLTNGFSKRIEQHMAAVAIHFMHYNFARPHQTLSKAAGKPTTPAMAAGIARAPWSLTQMAELLESN
jgi:IS1 family transposase